ncbi:MAG: ABC transporter permease subunit [Chloroflexi bacterium]|nr:ABC transporter permease subunit [Chloroflexota bacterium]MCH8116362.1 ABC transporter permease subunit [Chloroflexota bacterium]MCI0775123.1 ABC transporter permease subunit [Chloroflexota bacterium]MCI0803880.1 ABC transporter permease subunit [Chloroflexota bacterium]MCI0809122.1 ABC transporter permease subunit [Chloroflexota bacterium]
MGSVYRLTLRQLSGRWRLLITIVLASLPVVMGLIATMVDDPPSNEDFEGIVINGMLAGSILPLVVLAIASAAFANEIEDRTLANLTLSPIPRWQIVVPKLLGAMTVAVPFIVGSAFITSQLYFDGDMTAVIAVTVGAFVGVALYSSVFIWAGLMTTRAIGFGLLYVFLWEGIFSGFVSGVRFLSIRHYSIALMHGLDERRFAGSDNLSFGVAIGASVVVFVLFLLLSVRRLRRMDVP